MIKYTQSCRLCGSKELVDVINLGLNHVQGAFITKNNPDPPKRKVFNGIIRCDPKKGGCGLVQSSLTCPPEILFSSYFYQSGVNELMKSHLKSVVDDLLTFNPEPKTVLDLAANDLTLLKNYHPKTAKWGVDPNDIITKVDKGDINIVNDFFPSNKLRSSLKFDLISALAVLYDLENPVYFLESAVRKLKSDGVLCVEVMYLPSIIKNLAWDTFLFEHLTHWSIATLENLIKESGGKLINIKLTPTNGGSVLAFIARKACNTYDKKEYQDNILTIKKQEFDLALDEESIFVNFKNRVEQHQRDLKTTLQKLKEQNKTIGLFACSTKANVLIESCVLEEYFSYGIERSEEKFGGQTLWGLPIKSESEARSLIDENTVWMVGPYFFKQNTLNREKESIDKGLQLLFPLPEISLVNKENYNQHVTTQ